MEDNNSQVPNRPTNDPASPARRPMDDFSATPPQSTAIPISSVDGPLDDNASSASNTNDSANDNNAGNDSESAKSDPKPSMDPIPADFDASSVPSTASESTPITVTSSSSDSPSAPPSTASTNDQPAVSPSPTPTITNDVSNEKKAEPLIPGLNTKPTESAFDVNNVSEIPVTPPAEIAVPDAVPAGANSPAPEVISAAKNNKPRKKGKGAVIIAAVLIALALIGGAGYAFLQNKPATEQTTNTTNVDQEVKKDPANSEDIDKANESIDASLKEIDDTNDFQEKETSDATLGL
jgi:hypothetical protein